MAAAGLELANRLPEPIRPDTRAPRRGSINVTLVRPDLNR